LSSAAPSGGAVVTLASNNAATTVPGSVTVAAGGTSATFSATTQPVAAPVVTTVSASYGGISKSATLDVTPAITPGNIAGTASVTVSSQNTSAGQLGSKAIDQVIDGWPGDFTREWATTGQLAGAWIQLTWSSPVAISGIVLNDRPNLNDNVKSGTLSFSDGSTVAVGTLPNNGAGLTTSFSTKTVSWVKFTVTSASGYNIGLSE